MSARTPLNHAEVVAAGKAAAQRGAAACSPTVVPRI